MRLGWKNCGCALLQRSGFGIPYGTGNTFWPIIVCMEKVEVLRDSRELNFGIFLATEMICCRQLKFSLEQLEAVWVHLYYGRPVHGRDVTSGFFISVIRLGFLLFGMIEAGLFIYKNKLYMQSMYSNRVDIGNIDSWWDFRFSPSYKMDISSAKIQESLRSCNPLIPMLWNTNLRIMIQRM